MKPEAAVRVDAFDLDARQVGERRRAAGEREQPAQRHGRVHLIDAGAGDRALDTDPRPAGSHEHHVARLEAHVARAIALHQERIQIEAAHLPVGAQHAHVTQAAERCGTAAGHERVERGREAGQHVLAGRPHVAEHEHVDRAHPAHRHLHPGGPEQGSAPALDELLGVRERQPPQEGAAHVRQEHLALAIERQGVTRVGVSRHEHAQLVAGAQHVVGIDRARLGGSERRRSGLKQVTAELREVAPPSFGRRSREAPPQAGQRRTA